ncbi:MAG: hypothetical protein ABI972_20325 [Acidobacteriota bacterium]
MRGFVLSSETQTWPALRDGLESSGLFSCLRRFDPTGHDDLLRNLIRLQTPHVIILDKTSFHILEMLRDITAEMNPHIQLVVAGEDLHGDVLLGLMRNGVREYLPAPYGEAELSGPLGRLQQRIEMNSEAFSFTEDLFVFLPAQPGVGATTLAVQTSLALAEDRKRKTLLVDLDLSNGLISFLLRLNNTIPMSAAMNREMEMDDDLMNKLVASRGKLDVATSSEMQFGGRLDPGWIVELLSAARKKYQSVCVDVSEALEEHAVAAMQEAREIFLVCTPEVQVLYLARKRLMELERLGLSGRVRVIVNRATTNSHVTPAQVAELLGVPEYLPMANDYKRVSEAWVSGERIAPKSELGRDIRTLAAWMAQADIAEEQAKESRPKKQLGWMDSLKNRLLGARKKQVAATLEESSATGLAALANAVATEGTPPAAVPEAPSTALAHRASASRAARRKRGDAPKMRAIGAAPGQ